MTGERNVARKGVVGGLVAGLACAALPISAAAQTAGNDQIKQLQDEIRKIQREYQSQIRGLQKQLDQLKAAQAAPKAPPPAPPEPGLVVPPPGGALPPPVPGGPGAAPPPPSLPSAVAAAKRRIFGTGIDVSMANSFVEAASIFRTRNGTADISSNWNTGIPMPNNPNYHLSEFRESARQSRLALGATANSIQTSDSPAISRPISRASGRHRTRSRATATHCGCGRPMAKSIKETGEPTSSVGRSGAY